MFGKAGFKDLEKVANAMRKVILIPILILVLNSSFHKLLSQWNAGLMMGYNVTYSEFGPGLVVGKVIAREWMVDVAWQQFFTYKEGDINQTRSLTTLDLVYHGGPSANEGWFIGGGIGWLNADDRLAQPEDKFTGFGALGYTIPTGKDGCFDVRARYIFTGDKLWIFDTQFRKNLGQ